MYGRCFRYYYSIGTIMSKFKHQSQKAEDLSSKSLISRVQLIEYFGVKYKDRVYAASRYKSFPKVIQKVNKVSYYNKTAVDNWFKEHDIKSIKPYQTVVEPLDRDYSTLDNTVARLVIICGWYRAGCDLLRMKEGKEGYYV
jgi:hypothetical protein